MTISSTPSTTGSRRPSVRRRLAVGGVAAPALATSLLMGVPATAQADTSTAAGCVAAGKVWLIVHTYTGRTIANTCVGTPSTGTAALTAAGVSIQRSSGMICALGGFPSPCPTKFNGQYWQYYQLSPGGTWQYSQLGADTSHPKAGSVEGWCYNAASEKTCTPPTPTLTVTSAAASASQEATPATASATPTASASNPASTSTSSGSTSGPWGVVGTLAVLAAAGGGYAWWRHRRPRG